MHYQAPPHHLRALWLAIGLGAALVVNSPIARGQQPQDTGTQNQQSQAEAPIPAYRSPLAPLSTTDNTTDNSQNAVPDTRPLSGAQYISMSAVTNNRTYWQPRFDISGTGDSNPAESPSNSSSSWGAWTSFLGGADIQHTAGTSEMKLSYTGGGMYSSEADVPSGNVQELGVTEKIRFRRSVLALIDQLSYLPQASFGFGGVGGLPLLGGGSTGLSPGFTTGQSILTGEGQNLSNSAVLQLETFVTPRSSITMTGGYSVLHFFGNNLNDSGDVTFQGGYNYQLNRHDMMAAIYAFNDFRYSSLGESIYTHSVEGSYGRLVSGRLAFQVAAGPELAVFNQGGGPSGGTTGGLGASNGSSTHVYWTLNSSLNYQYQRSRLGVSYWHGVTEGSGVLAGAQTDLATGNWTRQMSRTFSSGLSAGYSRNASLPIAGSTASGENYDYWFAGASLARPFTETLALTLSYQMQYQTSNATFCIGPACGTSIVRHLVSVGLSWHERPLLF